MRSGAVFQPEPDPPSDPIFRSRADADREARGRYQRVLVGLIGFCTALLLMALAKVWF